MEKGIWKDSTNKAVVVAVKSLASEENKVKFLQEAVIMGQFRHPNIVNLHGVVTSGVPVSSNVLIAIDLFLSYTYCRLYEIYMCFKCLLSNRSC